MEGQPQNTTTPQCDHALGGAGSRRTVLQQWCLQFRVAILFVFGSRANEVRDWLEERIPHLSGSHSDVDIGVKALGNVVWSTMEKVRLAIDLEDFLGCSRVDLVVLDEADPFLAAEIIRGERLYAQDTYIADEYDLYVLRRAGDLIPLERDRVALILGQRP